MRWDSQRYRWIGRRLPRETERRLVVVTGARQTGKTTLARDRFPKLRYFNLDDLDLRAQLGSLSASAWAAQVGPAILDEAQKEPRVFDKVKYAYDAGDVDFTVLLGSSHFLLLEQVRESLAGRAFLHELWPLMPSEILHSAREAPEFPLLGRILAADVPMEELLGSEPETLLGSENADRRTVLAHVASWGGMPELLRLDDEQRREWLRSYRQTFLERDLADLARLRDLEPFRKLQRLCMLRTGKLLSYSDLARDAGIGATTARRYLEYLRNSYQVVLLQPYTRNLTSSAVKSPKLFWVDLGPLRQATRQWGELNGELFETLVVAEVHKWISTMAPDTGLYFYRTRSGLEVDLLVDTPAGIIGLEVKNHEGVRGPDTTAMRQVARSLGRDWLGGLLVYRGDRLQQVDDEARIWAVPAHRLF